jgi:hypothetical protein
MLQKLHIEEKPVATGPADGTLLRNLDRRSYMLDFKVSLTISAGCADLDASAREEIARKMLSVAAGQSTLGFLKLSLSCQGTSLITKDLANISQPCAGRRDVTSRVIRAGSGLGAAGYAGDSDDGKGLRCAIEMACRVPAITNPSRAPNQSDVPR